MNTKKIMGTSIVLSILQIIFIICTILLLNGEFPCYIVSVITGIICLGVANMIITIISYTYLQKMENRNLIASMKDLEELNLTLRAQRHDYLNQIQVVYGLMEMGEYEEARNYMNAVFKEITKLSKALKTSQPAVNALLQAKLQVAEANQIDMYLDIRTDLKDLKLEPWELCKVLANIIDNAITALMQKESEREIHVCMEQDEQSYIFQISNNGPKIPMNQRKLIFEEGYTTKKETGHGMGLYIVNGVIHEAGGSLEVESSEDETSFNIRLPR